MAVAIQILIVAPIRLGNLATIEVGKNLMKPNGPNGTYRLVFPDYDVKNRVFLDFPLSENATALIDEYIRDHWPLLQRNRRDDWLFPGAKTSHKGPMTLASQISKCIYCSLGLSITVHQFRHLAAAIILTNQPGNYELVRQLLGHRTVQTTMRSYISLETANAAGIFGEMVATQLKPFSRVP
jgi:integrase